MRLFQSFIQLNFTNSVSHSKGIGNKLSVLQLCTVSFVCFFLQPNWTDLKKGKLSPPIFSFFGSLFELFLKTKCKYRCTYGALFFLCRPDEWWWTNGCIAVQSLSLITIISKTVWVKIKCDIQMVWCLLYPGEWCACVVQCLTRDSK